MKPKILKSAAEYQAALAQVEMLMDSSPRSASEAKLELWTLLIEEYEKTRFALDLPDAVDAIKFRMEQQGLEQKDIAKYFPNKNHVSEVLSRKRPLSLGMIRSLHAGLGIPTEVLLS
jgi:HTH-type transcriptional regulator/antitoxin HigA